MATEIDKLPYNTTTELPARDIPRETIEHVADPQTSPTYVPSAPKYIAPQPLPTVDRWEEFRLPALLSILYFLWNVPSVQLMVERTFPSLFTDATMGLFAKSVCFGALYYAVTIGATYLGKP